MKSVFMGTGVTSGRNGIGLSIFRYLIIILCPSPGVFMAYGFSSNSNINMLFRFINVLFPRTYLILVNKVTMKRVKAQIVMIVVY